MSGGSRRNKAFTLVELVLMLAIISILAAIAGPRYVNSLSLYRAQAAAQRIAADINLARWQAHAASGQSIVFNLTSNNYSLPGVSGLPGQPSPYTVTLSSDPYGATLTSATFGSGTTLTYDQYGQPSSAGTVVVQSGSFSKTVTVDPNTGLATVQ